MTNRFYRLRHNPVVRRNNQNNNVGNFRTAGAHLGKCRVPRRIDKRYALTVFQANLIRTDMLRNPAGFMAGNVRRTQVVQQRRLAVVNVPHNRNNGRTRLFQFFRIFRIAQSFFHVGIGNTTDTVPHFFHDDLRRIGIYRLGNRCHNPQLHQLFYNVRSAFRHTGRQFLNGNRFGNDDFAINFFGRLLLTELFLAFLFARTFDGSQAASAFFAFAVPAHQRGKIHPAAAPFVFAAASARITASFFVARFTAFGRSFSARIGFKIIAGRRRMARFKRTLRRFLTRLRRTIVRCRRLA